MGKLKIINNWEVLKYTSSGTDVTGKISSITVKSTERSWVLDIIWKETSAKSDKFGHSTTVYRSEAFVQMNNPLIDYEIDLRTFLKNMNADLIGWNISKEKL